MMLRLLTLILALTVGLPNVAVAQQIIQAELPKGAKRLKLLRSDGTTELEGKTENGKAVGIWTRKTSDGKIMAEYSYKKGKLDGRVVQRYSSGKLSRVFHFKDGKPYGYWMAFLENGEVDWKYYFPLVNNKNKLFLELKYKYLCLYKSKNSFRCKSVDEAIKDLGTFLPDVLLEALLESIDTLLEGMNLPPEVNAVVACQNTTKHGVSGTTLNMDLKDLSLNQGSKSSFDSIFKGGGGIEKAVGEGVGQQLSLTCASQGAGGSLTSEPTSFSPADKETVGAAKNGMDQAVASCKESEKEKYVGWAWLAWTATPQGQAIIGGIITGVLGNLVYNAMDDGFSDNCTTHGSTQICTSKNDPNTTIEINSQTKTKTVTTKTGDGGSMKTVYYDQDNNASPSSREPVENEVMTSERKNAKGEVTETKKVTEVSWLSLNRATGQYERQSSLKTVHRIKRDDDGWDEVTYTSNDGGKTWTATSTTHTPPPSGGSQSGSSSSTTQPGGGAGQPADPDDRRSRCQKVKDAWAAFKAECDRSQWQTYTCQKFLANFTHCPDPARIYPLPDGSATCQANMSGSKEEARQRECERKGWIKLVEPDGNYSCQLPKKPDLGKIGDICNDPRAMCLPDAQMGEIREQGTPMP